MEILFLFLLLQVKHCYADFVLQTYIQTIKKGIWLDPIGISHTTDHVWCSLVALLIYGICFPVSAVTVLCLVLAEGIIHYAVDFTKVKYGSKDQTKPIFWTQFGIDQLAHQFTYIWMAWIICI